MKIFKIIKKCTKVLIFTKFDFLPPKKKRYLLFDNEGSRIPLSYLPPKKTEILFTRLEKLNLFILFKNFIFLKFTALDYFQSYIDFVNPDFILTIIDNNTVFYKLKKRKKKQIKIAIATTWRSAVDDYHLFTSKNSKVTVIENKNYNVDIILSINKSIGSLLKKLNAKKVLAVGSFRSNHEKITKLKKYGFLYISSYADLKPNHKVTNEINWKKFNSYQTNLIKNIFLYGKKYNKKIFILGKKYGEILINKEFKYYKNLSLNSNWEFIKAGTKSSLEIVDSSDIVLTLNSTLGYESFSRGNKTIFFDVRSYLKSTQSLSFGWPVKNLKKDGIFWTSKNGFIPFEHIVNKIYSMKKKNWNNLVNSYSKILMPRDKNNQVFKRLINTK